MGIRNVFYLVIFLEGYIVLASELLAIRVLVPHVGGGTETISIVIAAFLMPLSAGYYYGGNFLYKNAGRDKTIRKKIINNVSIGAAFLAVGLSYIFLEIFFQILQLVSIENRIIQVTIYSIFCVIYPVFLLGQTIPLISNFFRKKKLSKMAGIILFLSTMGSFCGSIISTLVLMSLIGVNYTLIVNIGLAVIAVFLLSRKKYSFDVIFILAIFIFTWIINSNQFLSSFGVIENNQYSTITIKNNLEEKSKLLSINKNNSAKHAQDNEYRFEYIRFIEDHFIYTKENKQSILVLGAGGFTLGIDDKKNDYVFVDIDPALKAISEEYLLGKKLGSNKKFIDIPARNYLRNLNNKFDIIVSDIYTGRYSVPFQLVTKEFFSEMKTKLTKDGVIIINIITKADFSDAFSVKIDNTIRSVFPNVTRQIASDFSEMTSDDMNILYIYHNNVNNNYKGQIYTDIKNSHFLDKSFSK